MNIESNPLIHKSFKLIDDIRHSYKSVLIVRIVFNSFKTTVVTRNLNNSDLSSVIQYVQQRMFELKKKKVDDIIIISKEMICVENVISSKLNSKPNSLSWSFTPNKISNTNDNQLNIIKIIETNNNLSFIKTATLQYLNISLCCLIVTNIR